MKGKWILIISILLEIMFKTFLPYSISDFDISISPPIYLILLLISQRSFNLLDNLITCVGFTMIYAFMMNLPVLYTVVLYVSLLIIFKLCLRFMLDSIFEIGVLTTFVVFGGELITHFIRYSLIYHKKVSMQAVLIYRITPTMIFTICFVFIALLILRTLEDHQLIRKDLKRIRYYDETQ